MQPSLDDSSLWIFKMGGNVAKKGKEKERRHVTKSDFPDLLLKLPSRWFQNIDPRLSEPEGILFSLVQYLCSTEKERARRGKGRTQATQPAGTEARCHIFV